MRPYQVESTVYMYILSSILVQVYLTITSNYIVISCLPSTIESSLHLVFIVSCYKEWVSWFHIRTKCLFKDFESKLRVMWNFVEVLQTKGKLKPLPFICQSTSNDSTISNSLLVPTRPKFIIPETHVSAASECENNMHSCLSCKWAEIPFSWIPGKRLVWNVYLSTYYYLTRIQLI